VNVTFVNYAGERTRLPGRVGDSLFDVAKRHKYSHVDGACGGGGSPRDLLHKDGGWYEPKYGEGAACYFCHVIIPKSHYAALPPKRPDELNQLRRYPFPEDMTDTSRLACQVRLSKDMVSARAGGEGARAKRAPSACCAPLTYAARPSNSPGRNGRLLPRRAAQP
jgi:ferredoxin